MKDYSMRLKQYWKFLLFLIILLVLLWSIDSFSIKDISVNIAASIAALIGSVFVFDVIIQKGKERTFNHAKKYVIRDMALLTNTLVSHTISPMGISVDDVDSSIDTQNDIELNSLRATNKLITVVLQLDLEQLLASMNVKSWRVFAAYLQIIKSAIFDNLILYKDLISPELLGNVLEVKNNFNSFHTLFSLVPDLFVNKEENWPIHKNGQEANRQIRTSFIKSFADDIRKYLISTQQLNLHLQKLYKENKGVL